MTHNTAEMGLGALVRPFGMATGATALAGGARVNRDHPHTSTLCLVGDKLAQLPKGPIAVARSLRCASNLYPRANACQFFQCYPARGAFRSRNKPLTDAVICIFLKPSLASRQSLQVAFGRLGFDLLERCASFPVPLPRTLDRLAKVGRAVRVGRNVDDSKISPQPSGWLIGRRIGFGLRDVQIPDAIAPYQFCAADLPTPIIERAALEIAKLKLPDHAPAQGVQAHLIQTHQPIGTHVVADRAVITKRRAWIRENLIGIAITLLRGRTHRANGYPAGTDAVLSAVPQFRRAATTGGFLGVF